MDPDSKRDTLLVALAGLFAVGALTASLIYLRHRPAYEPGVGPGPGAEREEPGPASAAADEPRVTRTDTVEVHDVPPPGGAPFPARSEPAGGRTAERKGGSARVSASSELTSLATPGGPEATSAQAGFDSAAPRAVQHAPEDPRQKEQKRPPSRNSEGLLTDSKLSSKANDLVKQAKHMTIGVSGGDSVDFSSPRSIQQAIMKQTAIDNAVDSDLRKRLNQLGPDADIEQKRAAAKDVLAAHGQPTDERSISNAVGTAMQAPGATSPGSTPEGAMDQAVAPTVAPHPPDWNGPVPPPAGPEFKPSGPPPADAMKAYQMYKADFDAALQKYGVRPEHILAIGDQESGFGKNEGKTPPVQGITEHKRWADLKAIYVLAAQPGTMPAPLPNLRCSPTGACGPWQFQPATCLSVACKPYDWHQLISDSVPKLLTIDGYKAGNPASQHQAFCRYYGKCADAHADYANDIDRRAANIKAGLDRLGASSPVATTK